MSISADADVGLSDIVEIQGWLDDSLNAYIFRYFVHGFYTGLFGISIWLLLAVKKISKAQIYMGCIITALYVSSTIYAIATWIELRRAFVFATSFRARYDLMNSSVWWDTTALTATAVNLIIADSTMVWRCWVVWAHNWKVIILPIFLIIGDIGMRLFCGSNAIDQYTVPLNTKAGTNWALATMAATLGTNILCTALIVARIIYVARGHRGIMSGMRTYRGVIEIVVESAALYSITFMVLMILYPLKGNGYVYPEAMVLPATGIAPTLIILRVALGQGRPKESSLETQSSLHFQTSRGSTIGTVTDGGDEDTIRGDMKGTALVLPGSVEQV
ncbi:hypothetical protein ARMGADRAFT_1170479 [Armillaria gallica]|uniref:Uncharacterized protein n=1 Tax=Armillaria gallica TaxID=47427 RepID=A0A2H3CKC6_ARMGA|nr:hypothetical protein ARMGADRAFT_1170479 [Armillaria gallica]